MIQQMIFRGTASGYKTVAASNGLLANAGLLRRLEKLCVGPGGAWAKQDSPCPVYGRCEVNGGVVLSLTVKDIHDTRNRSLTHLLYISGNDLEAFKAGMINPKCLRSAYQESREGDRLPELDPREIIMPPIPLPKLQQAAKMIFTDARQLAAFLQVLRMCALPVSERGFNGVCVKLAKLELNETQAIYVLMEGLLRAYCEPGTFVVGYRSMWNAPENNVQYPVFFTSAQHYAEMEKLANLRYVLLDEEQKHIGTPRQLNLIPSQADQLLAGALLAGESTGLDAVFAAAREFEANEKKRIEEERRRAQEEAERRRREELARQEEAERARRAELERQRQAEEKRKAEAERRRREELARQAEAERARLAELERQRQAEEKRKAEAERRRREELARQAEAERARLAELERQRQAEEKRRIEEERRRREELARQEEEKRKAEAERRYQEALAREIEEKRRAAAEAERQAEEERKAEAERRRREELERRAAEEAERKRQEEADRRGAEFVRRVMEECRNQKAVASTDQVASYISTKPVSGSTGTDRGQKSRADADIFENPTATQARRSGEKQYRQSPSTFIGGSGLFLLDDFWRGIRPMETLKTRNGSASELQRKVEAWIRGRSGTRGSNEYLDLSYSIKLLRELSEAIQQNEDYDHSSARLPEYKALLYSAYAVANIAFKTVLVRSSYEEWKGFTDAVRAIQPCACCVRGVRAQWYIWEVLLSILGCEEKYAALKKSHKQLQQLQAVSSNGLESFRETLKECAISLAKELSRFSVYDDERSTLVLYTVLAQFYSKVPLEGGVTYPKRGMLSPSLKKELKNSRADELYEQYLEQLQNEIGKGVRSPR